MDGHDDDPPSVRAAAAGTASCSEFVRGHMSPTPRVGALACALGTILLLATDAGAQPRRAITPDDLFAMHRVSEPEISPDGRWVVYTLGTPDMQENRVVGNLWIVPAGGDAAPRQLTTGGRDGGARWSPDSTRVAYLSTHEGTQQIAIVPIRGGEPTRVTSLAGGADHVTWSPDGRTLAFTSATFVDCADDACNRRRLQAQDERGANARVYDGLLYRHWTEWRTEQRRHLFVVPADGGTPRNLTPGATYDVPPLEREGPHPIAFSPDAREIAFVAVEDPVEAVSTNGDIFVVPLAGAAAAPVRLTSGPGFDGGPAYSPDGRWLAYRSQATAMYEADRWRLMRYDRTARAHTEIATGFDRSVEQIAWAPDGTSIYFNAEDRGHMPVFRVPAAGGTPEPLTPGTFNAEFSLAPDGRTLVMARTSQQAPAELVATNADGTRERALTRHNAERLAELDLVAAEHFTFAGAGGAEVHAMLLRPPAFDASRTYPLVMVLHGGPQTQFGDTWSWRWNAQVFAGQGHAILMINRRGSTGFGQAFTDAIRQDWGGRPFEDLMLGLDATLQKFPFLDHDNVAAAGASYGGYMIAWMASQSQGRFKALVAHAAVYNLESMYGATEELWFPEYEFGGPPWEQEEVYRRLSPHRYAGAFGKYRTPTLVIHGELDFRVPYTQGLEFYTALQRQEVPSRLIVFPDEGHWILKPQNSAYWYGEVLGWLSRWMGASPMRNSPLD
jgi:dipeptidyl aminopeptidase/acylaminoacyl peptidase